MSQKGLMQAGRVFLLGLVCKNFGRTSKYQQPTSGLVHTLHKVDVSLITCTVWYVRNIKQSELHVELEY